MKLYLIQHGEAKPEVEDPERPLNDRGMSEVKRVAWAARGLNIQPSKLFHSDKLRAKQTAARIAEGLGFPAEIIQETRGLHPADEIRPWVKRIQQASEDLMIVGHLPFLERLASFLLCGDESRRPILFRYGGIVCLAQKEDKAWAVRWILIPEMVKE